MKFYQNKKPIQTSSSQQVRQFIYQGSSHTWQSFKPYISDLTQGLLAILIIYLSLFPL